MSVYVDNPNGRLGRMVMCHLLADTLDELHAMDDTIGVARRHFQGDASTPHYDICKSKRTLAVKHGAVEADRRLVVEIIRRHRNTKGGA